MMNTIVKYISNLEIHIKMLLILRLVFVWTAIASQNNFFCKADQQFDQQSLNDFMSNCIRQDMGKYSTHWEFCPKFLSN